jgi:glutamyl-Q tRNA(Asp) synthetase
MITSESEDMTPVFRFAPSPNGYLHLGHALSALLDFEMARAARGRFLLRIEDIDATRCRPEYETAIYRDLAWLGIAWEEPVRRQSEHLDDYRAAVAKLSDMGLIYPSFESRSEIAMLTGRAAQDGWPCDPDGAPIYPGTSKHLTPAERARRMASEPYALRLDMAAAIARAGSLQWEERGNGPNGESGSIPAAPECWGDVVLARRETPTSYHISVVVDDAAQGVTHVVRGQDLFWATSVHRLLQALLGLPAPAYHHHRLLLDRDGRKLSKSTRATGLRELRAQGLTPRDIRRMIGLDLP